MRLGLDVAQHQLMWPELTERVQFAESAGFDGAWVFDHFSPLYGDPSGPCLEGWTLLAGLAAIWAAVPPGTSPSTRRLGFRFRRSRSGRSASRKACRSSGC